MPFLIPHRGAHGISDTDNYYLHLGNADACSDPTSKTTRRAYDLLAQGFGKGFSGPHLEPSSIDNWIEESDRVDHLSQ